MKCHYCEEQEAKVEALSKQWCPSCLQHFGILMALDDAIMKAKIKKKDRRRLRNRTDKLAKMK